MTFLDRLKALFSKPVYYVNRQVDGMDKGTVNANAQISAGERAMQSMIDSKKGLLVDNGALLDQLAERLTTQTATTVTVQVIQTEVIALLPSLRLGTVLTVALETLIFSVVLPVVPAGAAYSKMEIYIAIQNVKEAIRAFTIVKPVLALPAPATNAAGQV